jgi:alpha-galactosidase
VTIDLFLLARWQEDTNSGRMSLADFVAKQAILVDYLQALEQSRPSGKPTVWGRAARFGLWTAVKHLAEVYKDHPDWTEEW